MYTVCLEDTIASGTSDGPAHRDRLGINHHEQTQLTKHQQVKLYRYNHLLQEMAFNRLQHR